MSNNKQSSIDWLVKELNQKIDYIPMSQWDEIREIITKAKAMHKEEIKDAVVWFDDTDRRPHLIEIEVEQYYNETFGDKQ
jgi:hypothetical protein